MKIKSIRILGMNLLLLSTYISLSNIFENNTLNISIFITSIAYFFIIFSFSSELHLKPLPFKSYYGVPLGLIGSWMFLLGALTMEMMNKADVLVSMGCGVHESCLLPLRADMIDWGLEDPYDQSIEKYREIRDEIEKRVKSLIEEIEGNSAGRGI